jgi:hypothetical protein
MWNRMRVALTATAWYCGFIPSAILMSSPENF